MAVSRLFYLAALLGCGVFYIAYGEWFSWLLLLAVAGFPWLSLLVSLPAMLRFRAAPAGPEILIAGTDADLWLVGSCSLPMPPFQGRLRLKNHFTEVACRYRPEKGVETGHCGAYTVTVDKARVCDYLGLFSFPVRRTEEKRILIRPRPVPVANVPNLQKILAHSWRPKPGGGYGENHELRLYRPGDSLNQIHWKLTAKTQKLMIREPLEPMRGLVLLTLNLRGTPEELDRKLGRLSWLSCHILKQGIPHELRAMTGAGLQSFPIHTEQDLQKAVDALLCSPLAVQGDIRSHLWAASWQYHIGGEPDD